jgi:ATP-dependent Zn protease
MHRDFEKARRQSPSILFIDEIDAFGDRQKLDEDNRDYSIQVVNALLEEIDGSNEHEGLIIVGACNNANRIDPALRRPGRLDRFIQIPLPSPADRLLILGQYLDHVLPQDALAPASDFLRGMTGAHLERLARDARRSARRDGRTVSIDDVVSHLPARLIVPQEHRRSTSVHEIGHTLVGLALGVGKFVEVSIADWVNPTDKVHELGGAHFKQSVLARRDRDSYECHAAMLLGGIAAEIVTFGSHCDGGGLTVGSDLQKASDLLTEMEGATGMGHTLLFSAASDPEAAERLRRYNSRLAEVVEAGLRKQLERAKAIIVEERVLFDALCNALADKSRLDAEQVGALVDLHAVSSRTRQVALHPDSYSGIAAQ